jgi:hypothetical protein
MLWDAVTDSMCVHLCPNKTIRMSPMRATPSLTCTHLQRRTKTSKGCCLPCAISADTFLSGVQLFPPSLEKQTKHITLYMQHHDIKPKVEHYLLNRGSFPCNLSLMARSSSAQGKPIVSYLGRLFKMKALKSLEGSYFCINPLAPDFFFNISTLCM